jgi:osmotically-inducible protein OsmY
MRAAKGLALSVFVAGAALLPSPASAGGRPNDARLRQTIERRLFDKNIVGVKVAVESATVTLTGSVSSVGDVQDAEDIARRTHDVRGVVNELTVTPRESDRAIAEEVVGRLSDYPKYTMFDDVSVLAKNGRVTLVGAVTMRVKAKEMAQLASKVEGVRAVENEIRTLPASSVDDEIRTEVASRIYGDFLFQQYADATDPPIHILVEKSHVTLIGTVDSAVERQKAGIDAREVFGVMGVENDLQVTS